MQKDSMYQIYDLGFSLAEIAQYLDAVNESFGDSETQEAFRLFYHLPTATSRPATDLKELAGGDTCRSLTSVTGSQSPINFQNLKLASATCKTWALPLILSIGIYALRCLQNPNLTINSPTINHGFDRLCDKYT
jgi:hypothetical protein